MLGVESKIAEVAVGGRPVRLEALPIGIAPEEYTSLKSGDEATAQHYAEWVARYTGRRVLLAVDRLDYTKGVPERLRAYARLLRSSSELILSGCQLRGFHQHTLDMFVALSGKRGARQEVAGLFHVSRDTRRYKDTET